MKKANKSNVQGLSAGRGALRVDAVPAKVGAGGPPAANASSKTVRGRPRTVAAGAVAPSMAALGMDAAGYEKHRQRMAEQSRKRSESGRDIGPIPAPADPAGRGALRMDLAAFCLRYFPETFRLTFSADHLRVLQMAQRALTEGGQFAMAMPRGSGKTSIVEAAALWALLYGHRRFVVIVGADESAAEEIVDSIKSELEGNEHLGADFPEVCFPIEKMERIPARCRGQTSQGKPTRITWKAKYLVLPTVEGSVSSGGAIKTAGITGRIRGMKHKTFDGQAVRPDFVILDDPQTDESAESPSQCAKRLRILGKAVLGLAGPKQKISAICPCTVIRRGDVADQLLDRKLHPEWNGIKTQLMNSLPTNEKMWEEYDRLRRVSLAKNGDISAATAFYKKNQKKMDAGADPAWPERFNGDEISAVQYAMNIKLTDMHAFFAEYQNEPIEIAGVDGVLPADQIAAKLSGLGHFTVPSWASALTAFVDVQKTLLYYTVVAWDVEKFTGAVIDYGAFPDQGKSYFALSEARQTLQMQVRAKGVNNAGIEACIYAGLTSLINQICGREYPQDGSENYMRMGRVMIDASWHESTAVVYNFCRNSPYSSILTPSHGRGIGAATQPMDAWKPKPGEIRRDNWVVSAGYSGRPVRHISYDTNFWKTFLHARLATAMGDAGGITFWGKDPLTHRMIADHLCAEVPVRVSGRGRELDEWKMKPTREDNHLFDCMVGCAVGASWLGARLDGAGGAPRIVKRRKMSEMRAARSSTARGA